VTRLWTVVLIQDGPRVLLLHRDQGDPIRDGYSAPGGKIEYPESPLQGAIREVQEETGLTVTNLIYKGLHDHIHRDTNERWMFFNYLTTSWTGTLLQDPPEGTLHWIPIAEAGRLPMPPWFRTRWPWFFQPGTFELHSDGPGSVPVTVRT
jgi:8-oxo-dGTP diphosphatase